LKPNKFRSGFEERIYNNALDAGHAIVFEPSSPKINYTVPSRYIPDFRLQNGIFVEAKGYLRPGDRAKMKRVRAQNPQFDIRFLFQKASKRLSSKNPNSETYWQWAERHGFKWAEGEEIPVEWFNE